MVCFSKLFKTVLHALAAMLLMAVCFLCDRAAAQNVTSLTFNGSATMLTGAQGRPVLWLTPSLEYQAGSAFTTASVRFDSSYRFSTFFQFAMTHPNSEASDGMAFVIQSESATALGASGGYLGYSGITPSVAVEFDTWQNPWDINDNHVAILTNGQMNDLDPQTPYGVTSCQPSTGLFGCMNNGDTWSVWIDYDGANLRAAVADNSLTRPADLISYAIDLRSLFGRNPAFVGFTAGTGAGAENHLVLNWAFNAAH